MPKVLPVQPIADGASHCAIFERIEPGPAFQRNVAPTASGPDNASDFTPGFHAGQPSRSVSTCHTSSRGAAIVIRPSA